MVLPRQSGTVWISSFSGKVQVESTPKLPGTMNLMLGEFGVGSLVLIGVPFLQIENPFCLFILIKEPCSFNT